MKFNLQKTYFTNYCADSVEWCPFERNQHYFACGTYELQHSNSPNVDSHQVRLGQLHLFSVTRKLELVLHDTVNSSGILDIKWCPQIINSKKLLATANADGKILVWMFTNDTKTHGTIIQISAFELNNSAILSLSLDWSVSNTGSLCVSDSAGFLFVLQLNNQFELELVHKLKVHDYEAWVVTFDYQNSSLLLSGGDDCLLKITDTNTGKKVNELSKHESGVTAIKFNHTNYNTFSSGSYDETIKIWDSRNLSQELASKKINGGIWRIKWDPQDAKHILIAGMYSGIFLIRFDDAESSLQTINKFEQHESIAYGADFSHFKSNDLKEYCSSTDAIQLTATCSFYDKRLCLSFLQ